MKNIEEAVDVLMGDYRTVIATARKELKNMVRRLYSKEPLIIKE